MIRDLKLWNSFELEFLKISEEDFEKKLCLLEDLVEFARQIGMWPSRRPLDGLEVDFKIAKVLNSNVDRSSI